MENFPKSFDPRTLSKLRGLRLRAQQIVEGFVAGLHHSPHHGFSIEFAEHREYVPGDDLRHVDWKVFARTDKFYLKRFEDETNLMCMLAVDGSQSMRYRSPDAPLSKWEYAQCLAAAISWLILQQQDAVGLALFDQQLRHLLRPSGTASQWQQIMHLLEAPPQGTATAAGMMFHELAERLTRRSLVVILSDLFDDVTSLITGLKHLRHRRHDVIVFQIVDPAELDFPFSGMLKFRGIEGADEVVTDTSSLRAAYQEQFELHAAALRRSCREQGVDYALVRSDQPFDRTLQAYLFRRSTRTT